MSVCPGFLHEHIRTRKRCAGPGTDLARSQLQENGQWGTERWKDLGLTDNAWQEDKLSCEDATIPLNELPAPEEDNSGTTEIF